MQMKCNYHAHESERYSIVSREARKFSFSVVRIERELLIAGPLGLSRPMARYPTCLCIALCVRRGGALTSRGGTTRKTRPRTSTHAHERPHVRPIDAPYVRPPVRASSLARPPVRPSARPPARPPARPSVRARVGRRGRVGPRGNRRRHHRRRSRRRRQPDGRRHRAI